MPWVKQRAHGELPSPRKLYMGIELELEGEGLDRYTASDNRANMIRHMTGLQHPWAHHADGSLSMGREFCTQPFTFKYYQSGALQIPQMFEGLQACARPWNYRKERTAGVHIHVSRSAFTSSHLARFIEFHYSNPTLCKRVAGRSSESMASFKFDKYHNVGGRYDYYFRRFVPPKPAKTVYRELAEGKDRNWNRYVAVNCQNADTVELRYFSSTIQQARFEGYIQWVKALYDYTRVPVNPLTEKAFKAWLKEKPEFACAWGLANGTIKRDTDVGVVTVEPIGFANP